MAQALFVLDASVALAWGLEDESNPYTDAVLDALENGEAVVPAIWPLEVANALWVAERRGRITEATIAGFLEYLTPCPSWWSRYLWIKFSTGFFRLPGNRGFPFMMPLIWICPCGWVCRWLPRTAPSEPLPLE